MFSRSTIANTTSGIWDLPQSIGFTTAQTDESRSVGVLAILSPQTEELGLRPAQVRHCSLPSIQMMTELPLEPRLLHRFAPIWNSSSRIQRTYTVVYLQMGSSHIYWSTKPVQVCIVEQNLRRWYHIRPSLLAETIFPLAYSLSSSTNRSRKTRIFSSFGYKSSQKYISTETRLCWPSSRNCVDLHLTGVAEPLAPTASRYETQTSSAILSILVTSTSLVLQMFLNLPVGWMLGGRP